jgi:hypothetical protein
MLSARKQFKWVVTLADTLSGETKEYTVLSYWSEDKVDNISQEIMDAAAAEYNTFNDRRRTKDNRVIWAAVSAVLVEEEEPDA